MKRIIVNGRDYEIPDDELTFGELVGIVEYEALFTPTVTCRAPGKVGRTLVPGDVVEIEDGMIFSVAYTSKA
jgi:hypothetical protein